MSSANHLIGRSVPQWSRCYYDFNGAKIFTKHATKSTIILEKMKLFKTNQPQILQSQSEEKLKTSFQNIPGKAQMVMQLDLIESVNEGNEIFFKYHSLNKDVVFLFSQMKLHQLNLRLEKYEHWVTRVKKNKEAFYFLLANVYSEGKMLYRMCQVNLIAYKDIKAIHMKTFESFQLEFPQSQLRRLRRTLDQLDNYFVKLENIFMIADRPLPKRQRTESYQQIAPSPIKQAISSYIFGMTNGVSITLIILSIIIYGTSHVESYDYRFERDFPVWRAVAYVIFHIWAFAINTIIFEKYKINYSLIFGGTNMKQQSSFALYLASFFTFEYMILFVIYLLDLTSLITIDSDIAYYFPLIMWGSIFICILFPFKILHYKGRVQFFKQLVMTLSSPLFHVHFNVIFMTQQLISHILPFADIIYSFCYYIRSGYLENNASLCESQIHSGEYFGIIIFLYRLIQCLKVAHQNKQFKHTRQMYISIRASLNIFIIIISLISMVQSKMAIVWLIFAWPICIFNYYVDLKWDWGLLQKDSKNKYLRDHLVFNKKVYYFVMAINLFFRVFSLFAISQNIIYESKIRALYLIFSIAIIQIIRRLMWNTIKVQNQHSLNCSLFRVKKYYHQNQKLIMQQLLKDRASNVVQHPQDFEIQKKREIEEIINLQEYVQRKRKMKEQIEQWRDAKHEILEIYEKKIEEGYLRQEGKFIKKRK